MWGTLATSCREPLAKPSQRVESGAFGAWCTAAPDIALLCSPPPSPHDSRLAGLGARVGDRGGVEDESTFWEPFPPRPAKGQYETKLKSQGPQNPGRLSKPSPPTHDKFFGEKYGNWQEAGGKVIQHGTSGCLIEHSLSRRRCSCVIPERYPTPAEDADGQNMDPPMVRTPPLSILCLL